ncbi:MAG: hypothetical protein ABWY11_01100 [Umezawaea sp.]
MSRTDKTRPLWVQVADRRMVTCVPVHDHRFGPCTLPAETTVDTTVPGARVSGCHWGGNFHHLWNLSNGCRECTGYYDRRDDRRRSRHEARRELRGYRGED